MSTVEAAPTTPVHRETQPRIETVLLSALTAGAHARVVEVVAANDDIRRLQALGVCVGRRLQLLKAGDPMVITVVGARVGLSARLAAEVRVEPLDASLPFAPLANAS